MTERASEAEGSLSQEQLVELLAVLPASDSVELKLTVPESQHRSTVMGLGMDPLDAQIRQVVFFDTPDLALDRCGVVVRARRVQGKGDDSVVKLRPVVPSELPAATRSASGFNVEVDAVPGGFVCSGTMKRLLDPGPKSVKSALAGTTPVSKLFSKKQRQLFAAHAPDGIELDDLVVLGPIFVLKLRFTPPEFQHRLVAEVWHYPDGSRVLELSTKTTPDDAFPLAARLRAFLGDHGVELTGSQQTKTRKALEFFAAALQGDVCGSSAGACRGRRRSCLGGSGARSVASLQLPDDAAEILEPGPVATSAEVYLLSKQGDASVKVRESILDVKRLEHVSTTGSSSGGPFSRRRCRCRRRMPRRCWRRSGCLRIRSTGSRGMSTGCRPARPWRRHRGARPQDAAALLGRRLPRRADDADGGCAHGGHDRHRIGGRLLRVSALVDRLGFALQPNVSMARGLKELIGFGGPGTP